MNLFKKFRETIFLKENSQLENQIKELKELRETLQNKENIDRDIRLLEIGLQGEKQIAFELKNANLGMYVLNDIKLSCDNLNAQIDFFIVTKAYCYIIECKNMIGDITVNEQGEFRREYTLNNKTIKEAIYSPYTQAIRHKEILKKIWLKKKGNLTTLLCEDAFDNYYKPLVVLANPKSSLNIKYAPKNIKNSTIRIDQLIEYIKKI